MNHLQRIGIIVAAAVLSTLGAAGVANAKVDGDQHGHAESCPKASDDPYCGMEPPPSRYRVTPYDIP